MCCMAKDCIVERKTQDVHGNKLKFYIITHCRSLKNKEYVISKEAFSFKRWLLFMTLFSIIAFYCEFYNTDINFLGLFSCFLCLILIIKLHLKVKEESLLVIASLGLQLTTTFVTGRRSSQFIFQKDIHDVVINEGFSMHRVLFYLAILLKDIRDPLKISSIMPLFQCTLPRLDCLESIYQDIQDVICQHS